MSGSNTRIRPWLLLLCSAVLINGSVFAENVDPSGTGSQYAWGENLGWLNAEPQGDGGPGLQVGDSAVTGWIWAENAGWISLSCQNTVTCGANNYGVVNDGRGNLSGVAWGENIGWVNFRTSTGSSCCSNNGTPGCSNSTCEAAICRADPFCCNNNWDQACADAASASASCSPTCATTPYGVQIHGFTGIVSGKAWAENAGWINFGNTNPAANSQIKTGWQCPDPDADGVCSASDSCPTYSNPGQGTVLFGQSVGALSKFVLSWPSASAFQIRSGNFTTSTSIGVFTVTLSGSGSAASYTDPRANPTPGSGYWYLFRPNCPVGSYSTGAPTERVPGRDVALIP